MAANPDNRVGGVLNLSFQGRTVALGGSFSFKKGSKVRTKQTGLTGVVGHKVEFTPPHFEGEIYYQPGKGVTLEWLESIEDATCQLDLANGASLVLHEADQIGELVPDAAEGTMSIRLEGTFCDEVTR